VGVEAAVVSAKKIERGTWRDRPKDFSRFAINTLSKYLGWGNGSDGDHFEKTVWQPRIILFSRSDCWRCRKVVGSEARVHQSRGFHRC
jgi:hypothetical protein